MSLAKHNKLKTLAKNQKNGGPVVRARTHRVIGNGQIGAVKAEKLSEMLIVYLPSAIQAWVDALKANKVSWNPDSHSWEETAHADHEIRRRAALHIVEFAVGRAIERSMQVTGNYKELSELVTELKESPEAQRLIAGGFFDQLLRQDKPEPPKVEGQESSVGK